MHCTVLPAGCLVSLVFVRVAAGQGLLSPEQGARRAAILEAVVADETREMTADARMDEFRKATRAAGDLVDLRRELLERAAKHPGKALDAFLIECLANDADAGIRSNAATYLGRFGAADVLPAILKAATTDRQSDMRVGDVGTSRMSARRACIFACADLADRFPAMETQAVVALRELTVPAGFENENLSDARQQALFQITGDQVILAPFVRKLADPDASVRKDAVVAFRFFKLDKAPAELIATIKDPDQNVRSWTALVLGDIGDPQAVEVLKAAASDAREDRFVRTNAIASIGRMKHTDSAAFVGSLVADPDPTIRGVAAVALFQITGKRVKELPEGYGAK